METSPNIFPATVENTYSNKARTATRTNGDSLPTTAPWEDPVLRKAVGVVIAGKKLAGQPQARNWSTQSRQYQNASTTWYLPNDSCREESIHSGVLTYSQWTGSRRAYEMTGSSALPDFREQRSFVARKTSFHSLFLTVAQSFSRVEKCTFYQDAKTEDTEHKKDHMFLLIYINKKVQITPE